MTTPDILDLHPNLPFILDFNSYSNKKSFSILDVAKLFDTKINFLAPRKGERFASALSNMSLSNKVHKNFGKINLKDYIEKFIKNSKKY